MKSEIIKLNILTSYPVKWNNFFVMRDFVQNFFDAIGYEDFFEGFKYKYDSGVLTMEGKTSFDLDWLCYLGTSTKRDPDTKSAGRFGEGFKVAALIAYRDFGYDITMESKDWRIIVTEEDEVIDGKAAKCLAYKKTNRKDDGFSRLILDKVDEKQYDEFELSIKGFFYRDNPFLGRCIYYDNGYGVYEADNHETGILYAQYQSRYFIRGFPFVFSNPEYKPLRDDRDRVLFGRYDASICIMETINMMSRESAYDFLTQVRKYWSYNRKNLQIDFGETIIDTLIWRIMGSQNLCELFCKEYGDEIVAACPHNADPRSRRIASSWYSTWCGKSNRKMVRSSFKKLGIMNIVELCDREGGFNEKRRPNEIERKYISILEKVALKEFSDLMVYECLPETQIIQNRSSVSDGCALTIKCRENKANRYGMKVKLDIREVCVKSHYLRKEMFPEALATYLHELLHQYGSDSDHNFHTAIMLMDVQLSQIESQLNIYEEEWDALEN